jgi:hypothetical protein
LYFGTFACGHLGGRFFLSHRGNDDLHARVSRRRLPLISPRILLCQVIIRLIDAVNSPPTPAPRM